jgi:hypothetical protein
VNVVHNFPRFGHGDEISSLASIHRVDSEDYIRGMLSFCCFLLTAIYIWLFVLVILKVAFPQFVGCAGGGQTLDVARLRKEKLPRAKRRRRIQRAWRVQWAFLVASIMIPVTSLIMTRNGLTPFIHSLDEVGSIADEVKAVAFRGMGIAKSLQSARAGLANSTAAQQLQVPFDVESICPSSAQALNNLSMLAPLSLAMVTKYIEAGLDEVKAFTFYADDARMALARIVHVSEKLSSSVSYAYANDWVLKLFLLTINVVNAFFLVGVFLSQQDIVSYSYQRFLSYSILPVFVLLLVISAIVACAFGMATMLNAGTSRWYWFR